MASRETLIKVAAGTFLLGSTGVYLAQKRVQWKVRALPHYKESLVIVRDHPKATSALGVPIEVGTIDISDRRHNYVGKTKSYLRIPVSGQIDAGHLDVMAIRDDEQKEFVTAKVQLLLSTGVFTIYDTGAWSDQPEQKSELQLTAGKK